jgi:lipopolysaccharide transport system permease protein
VANTHELFIKPRRGWQPIDFRELWNYRDLFGVLVWRDIKIRYKQTAFGAAWALLQPLVGMLIFGVLFNRIVNMPSDGSPYLLFVYAGLVPWTFFVNGVSMSSNSLVGNDNMIRKIYFPRLMLPMGSIGALGLDMLVSLSFMAVLMVHYRWQVSAKLLLLPVFMVGSFMAAGGLGLILAALNVQFRDVKYIVPFFTQMLLFLTPVLYPTTKIPSQYQFLMSLNPMAGVVEGFRYSLLGSPVSWDLMGASLLGCVLIFLAGLFFFTRMDRSFADVI